MRMGEKGDRITMDLITQVVYNGPKALYFLVSLFIYIDIELFIVSLTGKIPLKLFLSDSLFSKKSLIKSNEVLFW